MPTGYPKVPKAKKEPMKPEPSPDIDAKMSLAEFAQTAVIKNGFASEMNKPRSLEEKLKPWGGKMPPFAKSELIRQGFMAKS